MSLWPVIFIECIECHKRKSVFDFAGLDVAISTKEQREFYELLSREGWKCPGIGIEADDDGTVGGLCPRCAQQLHKDHPGAIE